MLSACGERMYSSTICFQRRRHSQPRKKLWTFLILAISGSSSSSEVSPRSWLAFVVRDTWGKSLHSFFKANSYKGKWNWVFWLKVLKKIAFSEWPRENKDTIWHNQTQSDTTRHKLTQTNTSRHKLTQTDRTRHNQKQPDKTRHNQTKPDKTRQNQTKPDTTRHNQIQPDTSKLNL